VPPSPELIALVMEAASAYETPVSFYQSTRHNNPEDSDIHTRRRENLKSDRAVLLTKLIIVGVFH
jgi:hypothetical protein